MKVFVCKITARGDQGMDGRLILKSVCKMESCLFL